MMFISIIKNSKGQVLVVATITLLFFLIGVTALAIDLGVAYAIKSKLNSAVDAAAVAGGRSVKTGATDAARKANGENAALTFFNANFPAGFMKSSNTTFTATATRNSTVGSSEFGTWTLAVSASTRNPKFFSGIFHNLTDTIVGASAEAKTRTLDMMIVLDCSGSLANPPGTFDSLKNAAMDFIDKFQDGTGGDRIGFVAFGSGAVLNLPIDKTSTRGFTRSTLYNSSRSSGIIPNLDNLGGTNSEEALRKAKSELDLIPSGLRSSLRVIVFFSDGAPNTVTGNFISIGRTGGLYAKQELSGETRPHNLYDKDRQSTFINSYTINTLPPTDWSGTINLASFNNARTFTGGNPVPNTEFCNANRAARNMTENIANSARGGAGNDAITIFSIGLGNELHQIEHPYMSGHPDCGYDQREWGENILKRLANTPDSDTYNVAQPAGLYVYAADASQLNAAFQTVAKMILRLSK